MIKNQVSLLRTPSAKHVQGLNEKDGTDSNLPLLALAGFGGRSDGLNAKELLGCNDGFGCDTRPSN
jgi:hypothetical protein